MKDKDNQKVKYLHKINSQKEYEQVQYQFCPICEDKVEILDDGYYRVEYKNL